MAQETVETAIYRLRVEGQDQIDRLTRSIGDLTIAEEKATAQNRTTSDDLQKRLARYDPLIRAQQAYSKELQIIAKYQETGVGTQQELNALLALSTQRYRDVAKSIEQVAVAAENSRRAQANVAAGPGQVVQAAGGASAYAAQFEAAAKAQDEQIASITKLRGAMNSLEVEQGRIAKEMLVYRQALQEGKISQQEFEAAQQMGGVALQRAQKAAQGLGEAHKGLSGQSQAALHSVRSFFEQIALGQSPVQAAIGQLSHLSYVATGEGGIAGAFKGMASSALAFVTSLPGIATGVLAVGAAFVYVASQAGAAQKAMDLSLIGAGRRTGTTAADINQFAARTAAERPSGGMSEKEIRALGQAFTENGDIVISKINGMNTAIMGFAEKTGVSVKEASDAWVKFGSDPLKAMDALAGHFGEFDQRTRNAVETAQAAGDKTRALQIIVNSLTPDLQKAADTMGFWAKGWRDFVNLLSLSPKPLGLTERLKAAERELKVLEDASKDMFAFGPVVDTEQIDKAREKVAQLKQEMAQVPANAIAEQAKVTAQAIAQATKNMQEQLGVASAVGGAQRLTAQYALDYATVLDQTRNAAVAIAVATERQAIAQAQVNAQAKETLFSLQNQAAASAAVTGAEQMKAQAAATYNQLVHDGVDALIAQQVAAKQLANAHAQANAAVEKQIQSLEDSTRLIKAQANGTGEAAERAIAYDNAIKSGASSTQAANLAAAMLANQTAKAAANAGSYAANMQAATQAMMGAAGRGWTPDQSYVATSFASRAANEPGTFVGSGGSGGSASLMPGIYPGMSQELFDYTVNQYKGGTSAVDAANQALQASQSTWKGLTDSVDNLKNSTDQLNATNQELLSPYYTQDPRTSHIGFRSQGMASGGFVDVPGGISSNDNMIATIPVASGERIYIDPANNKRGTASGGNLTINISSPVLIQGNANRDEVGRTLYQNNQALAKQMRAVVQ